MKRLGSGSKFGPISVTGSNENVFGSKTLIFWHVFCIVFVLISIFLQCGFWIVKMILCVHAVLVQGGGGGGRAKSISTERHKRNPHKLTDHELWHVSAHMSAINWRALGKYE